jgi:hypothetical protein
MLIRIEQGKGGKDRCVMLQRGSTDRFRRIVTSEQPAAGLGQSVVGAQDPQ